MPSHEIKKIAITKLDAARRQLETAITLWFQDWDPVSVHTLTAAAYRILYDINKQLGGTEMMPDSKNIRPEFLPEYRRLLTKSANFFKHAESDASKTLHFAPQATQLYILEASRVYREIAHEERPLIKLFTIYLGFHEPRLFLDSFLASLCDGLPVNRIKQMTKRQFFEQFYTPLSTPIPP